MEEMNIKIIIKCIDILREVKNIKNVRAAIEHLIMAKQQIEKEMMPNGPGLDGEKSFKV